MASLPLLKSRASTLHPRQNKTRRPGQPSPAMMARASVDDLPPDPRPLGCESFPWAKELPCVFDIEFANFLRMGEKIGMSLPGKIALRVDRLLKRARRHESLSQHSSGSPRFSRVVGIGGR